MPTSTMHIHFNPFPQQRQKKENRPLAKPRKPCRTTFIDLTGRRFGRWTVLGEFPGPRKGQTRWHCRCDCGKEKPDVLYGGLVANRSQSCGCLRMEGLVKPDDTVHHQRNPRYSVWQSIRTRCFNSAHPSFKHYGARGITMCPEWESDFDQFMADMGPRPEGLTIERIDNNGNYEPGNCKWGTRMEQAGNTRRNLVVQWEGRKCNMIDVARQTNVDYASLCYRHQSKGMSIEDAVAELQTKGSAFHERAAEAGSTRKNKTNEKRGLRNFWNAAPEKDLTGKVFGRWTVIAPALKGSWMCRCSCGAEKSVQKHGLVSGESKSCGCLKREQSVKPLHQQHGHKNPTYRSWHTTRSREGVCPEWLNSFNTFLADMGPRPEGTRLVSMDGRRWSKGTCEWRAAK